MKVRDITSKRFGRLVAIERLQGRGSRWLCRCDCGREVPVRLCNLGRITRSCGCLRREVCKARERKKGHPTHGAVLSYYKRNAAERGITWELSSAKFAALIAGRCFYCDAPPAARPIKGVERSWNGIDRLYNNAGYGTGNVVTCCATCNWAKNTMDVPEFLQWVRRIQRNLEL